MVQMPDPTPVKSAAEVHAQVQIIPPSISNILKNAVSDTEIAIILEQLHLCEKELEGVLFSAFSKKDDVTVT